MGKRGWLEELIEQEYFPAITQLSDTRQGHDDAKKLVFSIRQGWTKRGLATLRQQESLMNRLRQAIREKFGDKHFSLTYIDFSRDEYFELNHHKQEQARDRQLHQQYIKDPDAIVATAVRLLDSPEWSEIAAGLAVLTGRRLNEVLKTAEFTVKSQWVVTFKGALKRRGEPVPLVFDIPTLTPASRVVEATQRLRQITPLGENETKVALASDRHFSHLVPAPAGKANLYSHLWRSVYCCIATFWYCPKHVDDLLFKAHIMGHFESLTGEEKTDGQLLKKRLESFSSERHYRLYEIDDDLIAYHQGKRKGIKLGIAGIQPLDTFQQGLPENQPKPMERKHRSTLRIWREDHDSLIRILQHFEGKTQPDKVAAWLEWTEKQLEQQQITSSTAERLDIGSLHDEATGRSPEQEDLGLDDREDARRSPTGEAVQREDGRRSPGVDVQVYREEEWVLDEAVEAQQHQEPDAPIHPIHPIHPIPTALEQPPMTAMEAKLDRLLDVMALFVQAQTHPQALQGMAIAPSRSEAGAQATGDPSQAKRPRKYKTGEADAIIQRAIDAIIRHNDQPGRLHDEKWAITINGLKNFSSNQRVIERIMEERKDEIQNHHLKHQLQSRHNDRHKRKYKISDVIHL